MAMNKNDEAWLERALAQATQAIGLSDPNPRVGCVVLDASGAVLAQAHTQQAGGPHAEAMALQALGEAGLSARGGTAYVTLEPCAHHGRTPPCADALAAAGLSRVVVALRDPNPLVAGKGLARLAAAGIEVDVLDPGHPLAVAAHELNVGFLSRMTRHRPWVRLKAATSLDGRTALDNGDSKWITGPSARADGHIWRKRASAIITGIGTVLADDPQMDVRGVSTARQPVKVVLDSHWRLPLDARLWLGDAVVWVYGLAPDNEAAQARRDQLLAKGALVVELPASPDARVDLGALLADLAWRGVNELHVEAGARLNAALFEGGWVDELLVYLAPKLLGPGRPMADLGPLSSVNHARGWLIKEVSQVGDDVRMILRTPDHPVSH
jgi:diaminohydroxyphosphoribosylaminopyrimidine deaminase/5-amino-6-(5-phosphoribosylamino)uracil reductase